MRYRRMTKQQLEHDGAVIVRFILSGHKEGADQLPGWYKQVVAFAGSGLPLPGIETNPYIWRQRFILTQQIQNHVQEVVNKAQQAHRSSGLIHAPAGAIPRSRMS